MKAWVHTKKGNPAKEALKLVSDHPEPEPHGEQIKVKVHAAALNPVFYKGMSIFPSFVLKKPLVPEADFSGEIVGGRLEGTGFAIGDKVFGQRSAPAIFKDGHGSLAEYTLALPNILVHVPDNVSYEEAAAFPLAGSTAYQALTKAAGLKKGANQRVFINGGSSGVGSYAVQIAKAYDAYVVTTKSPSSVEMVSKLGADEALDYREKPLTSQLTEKFSADPFDIIFDTIGVPQLYYACPAFLKKGGTFADVAGKAEQHTFSQQLSFAYHLLNRSLRPSWLGGTPRKYKFVGLSPETYGKEALSEAASLMQKGKLKSFIDSEHQFEDAQKAYEKIMSGRAKGKLLVKVIP